MLGFMFGRNGFVWHYDGDMRALAGRPPLSPENDRPSLTKVWERPPMTCGLSVTARRVSRQQNRRVPSGRQRRRLAPVYGTAAASVWWRWRRQPGYRLKRRASPPINRPKPPPAAGRRVEPDGTARDRRLRLRLPQRNSGQGWTQIEHGLSRDPMLHAWSTHGGFAVGGNVLTSALDGGVAIHNRAVPC